jgi:hypothetical protein
MSQNIAAPIERPILEDSSLHMLADFLPLLLLFPPDLLVNWVVLSTFRASLPHSLLLHMPITYGNPLRDTVEDCFDNFTNLLGIS